MKQLVALLLLAITLVCRGQTVESVITVPIDNGQTEKALLYVPQMQGKLPLLVFAHGSGEAGNNLALIYTSSESGGPSYYIEQKQWPSSYPFIVISPQSNNWSTTGNGLDSVVRYMVRNYSVDTTRIYLTGLSAGGQGIYDYTAHNGTDPRYTPAAIVPMSMATDASNAGVQWTLSDNVRVWGFGSESDIWGIQTHMYITGSYGGNNGPTPPALGTDGMYTAYSGGHCCWGQFYTPQYELNGFTIYAWMLQYQRPTPVLALSYVNLSIDADGLLTWTVNDTTDIDHFIIQQSTDGTNFETIATTTAYSWM